MRYGLLALTVLLFAYVIFLAWGVNAASPQVITGYVLASLAAWALAYTHRPWAGAVKWTWVALSIVVIAAIVAGPLNFLRVS